MTPWIWGAGMAPCNNRQYTFSHNSHCCWAGRRVTTVGTKASTHMDSF